MYGQVQKQNCLLIDTSILDPTPVVPIPVNPFIRCCYTLDVYASTTDADPFKNDKRDFLKILPKSVTSVTIRLQKFVNGVWTNVATLNNNNYGTFSPLGFATKDNNTYIGYYLDFRSVLLAHNVGKYRVQFDLTSTQFNSEEYCLRNFSEEAVDETTKIRWIKNSIIGDANQTRTNNFVGLKRENQMRVSQSIFGFKKGTFETETQRWQNGYERTHKKTDKERYTWEIRQMPSEILDVLRYDALMGDDIFFTDYNSRNNSGKYIEQAVEIVGEFAPNYDGLNPHPSVILEFMDKYSNRQKFYS
jgi:hypothetical protein